MLHLTSETKILLATQPVDFRKQIDGLVALCHKTFQRAPRDGALYIFINRSKTMIKVLCYEKNGYWLAMKRLSRGRYKHWPKDGTGLQSFMAHELKLLFNSPLP